MLNKPRIAVLPFVNMSGDPENEYFSDGMTEELISQLSKISRLEVIARTSVMKYKGKDKDIAEIGQALWVGTVLEGSVRKAADKLRITVQLINVQNQTHLWSKDYDRELKDVFEIQSDIAQRVMEALKVQLLAGEKRQIEKKGTANLEVYNLYLKGHYHLSKLTKEGVEKSIEYFEQAIEKDPSYARVYAGLAGSYGVAGYFGYSPTKEAFLRKKALVKKALELDDTIAEAHTSLGDSLMNDWDWSDAEREFKRGIELNPSNAGAHFGYLWYLLAKGRFAEAIVEAKQAQELDPLSLNISAGVGWAFCFARQYDQAIEQFQKTVEMDPNFWMSYSGLGEAYINKGMYEEAVKVRLKMRDLLGNSPEGLAELGYAYAMSGRKDEARKVLEELKERSKQEYIMPIYFAWIYLGLGEKDQTFEWLEKAYEERSGFLNWLKVGPYYDSLRSDPRFTEMLKKVGLPAG
jgi:TolB-like protein/Tfp pilus assembly protein PilF